MAKKGMAYASKLISKTRMAVGIITSGVLAKTYRKIATKSMTPDRTPPRVWVLKAEDV